METMNYNRDNKKKSKAGIIGFFLFACVGTAATFYMIANEPQPIILGQDLYVPTTSTNTNNAEDYSDEDITNITYEVEREVSKYTSGNFKSKV